LPQSRIPPPCSSNAPPGRFRRFGLLSPAGMLPLPSTGFPGPSCGFLNSLLAFPRFAGSGALGLAALGPFGTAFGPLPPPNAKTRAAAPWIRGDRHSSRDRHPWLAFPSSVPDGSIRPVAPSEPARVPALSVSQGHSARRFLRRFGRFSFSLSLWKRKTKTRISENPDFRDWRSSPALPSETAADPRRCPEPAGGRNNLRIRPRHADTVSVASSAALDCRSLTTNRRQCCWIISANRAERSMSL
jgi:hypothetical protein